MPRLFFILLLICFSLQAAAQPTPLRMRPLEGYYITDDAAFEPGLNCIVVTNRRQFEKLFGYMNRPDTPNFSRELMLVLAFPPGRQASLVGFHRVLMKAGNFVEVYCAIERRRYPLTYKAYPIIACAIPRHAETRFVRFYNEKGMKLLKNVELKQ